MLIKQDLDSGEALIKKKDIINMSMSCIKYIYIYIYIYKVIQ